MSNISSSPSCEDRLVILHVGLPKTGTSSIQKTLAINNLLLANSGYIYPTFINGSICSHNHSLIFRALFDDDDNFPVRFAKMDRTEVVSNYMSQFQELLNSGRNIVFSGEGISFLNTDSLINIRDLIEKKDYRIKVIAYIRSPYSLQCSTTQQSLKTGVSVIESTPIPRVAKRLKRFIEVFECVEFHPFKKTCAHRNGPVGFFLETIGVKNQEDYRLSNDNEGLSNKTVRIINHINKYYPNIVGGEINRLRPSMKDLLRTLKVDGSKFLLTEDEFLKIRDEFLKERSQIIDYLGPHYCEESIEHSNPVYFNDDEMDNLLKRSSCLPEHIREVVLEYLKKGCSRSMRMHLDLRDNAGKWFYSLWLRALRGMPGIRWLIRRTDLDVEPVWGAARESGPNKEYDWHSISRRPTFVAKEPASLFRTGWYMVEFRIRSDVSSANARIFFYLSNLAKKDGRLLMPYYSGQTVKRLLFLRCKPKGITVMPIDSVGRFSIESLSFVAVMPWFARSRMLKRLAMRPGRYKGLPAQEIMKIIASEASGLNRSVADILLKRYNQTFVLNGRGEAIHL